MRLDHLLSMENVAGAERHSAVFDARDSGAKDCCSIFREQSLERQKRVGLTNAGGPPVPIPNTEVKPCSAEDTLPETARENRSRPTQTNRKYAVCLLPEA